MKKITKKAYTEGMAALEAELSAVKNILALALVTEGASLPNLDMWNKYHDREWEIEQAMEELEMNWNRRNWTAAEYNTAALIAANID